MKQTFTLTPKGKIVHSLGGITAETVATAEKIVQGLSEYMKRHKVAIVCRGNKLTFVKYEA